MGLDVRVPASERVHCDHNQYPYDIYDPQLVAELRWEELSGSTHGRHRLKDERQCRASVAEQREALRDDVCGIEVRDEVEQRGPAENEERIARLERTAIEPCQRQQ